MNFYLETYAINLLSIQFCKHSFVWYYASERLCHWKASQKASDLYRVVLFMLSICLHYGDPMPPVCTMVFNKNLIHNIYKNKPYVMFVLCDISMLIIIMKHFYMFQVFFRIPSFHQSYFLSVSLFSVYLIHSHLFILVVFFNFIHLIQPSLQSWTFYLLIFSNLINLSSYLFL